MITQKRIYSLRYPIFLLGVFVTFECCKCCTPSLTTTYDQITLTPGNFRMRMSGREIDNETDDQTAPADTSGNFFKSLIRRHRLVNSTDGSGATGSPADYEYQRTDEEDPEETSNIFGRITRNKLKRTTLATKTSDSDVACGTVVRFEDGIRPIPGEARYLEFPWQVRIIATNSYTSIMCGGALISAEHVLTSASCFPTNDLTVVAVLQDHNKDIEAKKTEIPVRSINRHPNYRRGLHAFDIAVLVLQDHVSMTNATNSSVPICFPDNCHALDKMNADNRTCFSAGWRTSVDRPDNTGWSVLQKGIAPDLMPSRECRKAIKSVTRQNTGDDWSEGALNTVQCTGISGNDPVDNCQADTGGPLVCQVAPNRYILDGILSFHSNCASSKNFDVYIRPCKFSAWIKQFTSPFAWKGFSTD